MLICTGSFAAKAAPKAAKVAAEGAEFKDSRDKQKYRLVKIADREWFGDNLNFKSEGSYCLDDDENNCMAYGRLYTWDAAQKACPAGFRLPATALTTVRTGTSQNSRFSGAPTMRWKESGRAMPACGTLRTSQWLSALPPGRKFSHSPCVACGMPSSVASPEALLLLNYG